MDGAGGAGRGNWGGGEGRRREWRVGGGSIGNCGAGEEEEEELGTGELRKEGEGI